jgi:Cytosol aminopeptidase family, N-terminal domain
VELHFIAPELRRLDDASAELCACSLWTDVRPMRGLAGLLDWRLGGRLSALLKTGFLSGRRGEALLVPGKPHVPFEKVLVVGLGKRAEFDDATFRAAMMHIAKALEGLRVRRAVVELPGRGGGDIDPDHAITMALECVGDSSEHDAWWLIEAPAAQRRIERRAAEERRRVRMA